MKTRKAFTIVEVTIAATLLVVVFGAAYQLFFGVSKGFQRSTKSLAMQNEIRNGLNFIREEMQRASYRAEVKINGTNITESGYEFRITNDSVMNKAAAGEKKIAEWSICKPFNKTKNTGFVFESSINLKNGDLVYNRIMKEKGSAETEEEILNKVVIKGVETIKLEVEDYESGNEGAMLNIEVVGYDKTTSQPDLSTSAQTGAKIDVKIKKDL